MDLTHDFIVPAGIDETWAAFNHLELIASCFPGASLTSVDGQAFSGTLKLKLGSLTLDYLGTGRFTERHVGGRHTVIEASGTDTRGKGTVTAKITTSLTSNWDTTAVRVDARLTFTGQPGQFAPAVVEDASNRWAAQFADAVAVRFAGGLGAEALAADADPNYAGSLGESASSSSTTYTYRPPAPASQTDYDVFARVAPILAKRLGPPLLGGLVLLWLVRKVTRR